jgi:hypothetical protein
MRAIVKHEGEVIATVQTNHSMSIEEVLEIAGINEMEDENTPKYNYDALRLEMEQE